MRQSRRVLVHLTAEEFGGVETHVYFLAMLLASRGHKITLVSHRKFALNSEWRRNLRNSGVRIVALPSWSGRLPGPARLLIGHLNLRARLRRRSFDLVLGEGHGGAFAWLRPFVADGGRMIWEEYWDGLPTRGDDYADGYAAPTPVRFSRRMHQMIAKLDGVVTGCERARRNLRDIQGVQAPIRVVAPITKPAMGVPVDRTYTEQSHLHIGMVARHGFGKGTSMLGSIWSELDIGAATLHLWGPVLDPQLLEQIQAVASTGEDIRVHGPFERATLGDVLDSLDIGLMLSVEEGYGLVVCEYMAAGLPIVMTDVGAAEEFSRDNLDAVIVAVSPEAVAEGIEDMARRVRSGMTSRERLHQRYVDFHGVHLTEAAHVEMVESPSVFWSAAS